MMKYIWTLQNQNHIEINIRFEFLRMYVHEILFGFKTPLQFYMSSNNSIVK